MYYSQAEASGEVPKWSNGSDSKSAGGIAPHVGSNPTLSAILYY
jgi:hypothetical protein